MTFLPWIVQQIGSVIRNETQAIWLPSFPPNPPYYIDLTNIEEGVTAHKMAYNMLGVGISDGNTFLPFHVTVIFLTLSNDTRFSRLPYALKHEMSGILEGAVNYGVKSDGSFLALAN